MSWAGIPNPGAKSNAAKLVERLEALEKRVQYLEGELAKERMAAAVKEAFDE